MLPVDITIPRSKSAAYAALVGFGLGVLLELPTIFAAIISGGAGHGDYIAARALFPSSMLLTLLEGRIGEFSIGVALLQFPIYGMLLGWSIVRRNYLPAIAVASLHVIAAIFCFAGTLPNFS